MTMADKDTNGRTHEPNLRELTAELDGLRELLLARFAAADELAKERDKWYSERDKDRTASVDRALTAAKEQTASSFVASKEAILKAEDAQRAYNTAHNDLARKMDEQNKATMPRTETETRFRSIEEKVNDVRTVVANVGASALGGKAFKEESRANIAIVISFLGLIGVILARIFGNG